MDKQGWKDIAYDVVGCPHGNTYQGRLGTNNGTGANGTREANEDYMAVMGLIGDGEEPTPALYVAIRDGIKMCQDVGAGEEITGHGAFVNTPCPGPLWPWVRAGAPVPEIEEEVVTEVTKLTSRLAYGSKGAEVTLLQNMLNGLIEAGLTVDGSFGTATENKVKEFQTSYGFDADGIVGPITRGQLNSDWDEFNTPVTPEPEPEEPELPIEPPVEPEEPVIDEPTPEPEPTPVVDEPEDPVVDFPSEEPTVADLTLAEFFEILDEYLDEGAIADRILERIVQKLTA
jgi:hypothetical protein